MEKSPVWFSHREYRYDAGLKSHQRVFQWSDKSEIWDWDNCTVSAVNVPKNKLRVVIRSGNTIHSDYMKRDIQLKYMLGFDIAKVHDLKAEEYNEPPPENAVGKAYGKPKLRWVFQLDDDYWIWEWADKPSGLVNNTVYGIHAMIKKKLEAPDPVKRNIFDVPTHNDNEAVPAIYQPAIDSWKNYVREVHCHRLNGTELEVTILFNNEELRAHAIANPIYEWFRSLVYGRVIDVESFKITLSQEIPADFEFRGIYSGEHDILADDVHGDRPDFGGNVPRRSIKYYFSNTKHPVVFINTSNHAMAEHDTNHRLWKWEYVPLEEGSPLILGSKSRKQIDKSFRPKLRFW